jgi:hypothetical protein
MLVRMWGERNISTLLVKMKISATSMESNMMSLKKLKIQLSYDPTIPLLGTYLKECTPGYDRDTCTPMFTVAIFATAKLWKQSRCATTDEWIKKMWNIYIMEFYSAMKRNEIMLFAGKWMELKNFMLSEVSQAYKIKGHVFSHMLKLDL